jgi:hypothetical protein
MTFNDLVFEKHCNFPEGQQALVFFGNGYGASVVRFDGSYGYKEGKWELAVLAGNRKAYKVCYSTPITDDVIGYLDPDQVSVYLREIESLPKVSAGEVAQ